MALPAGGTHQPVGGQLSQPPAELGVQTAHTCVTRRAATAPGSHLLHRSHYSPAFHSEERMKAWGVVFVLGNLTV